MKLVHVELNEANDFVARFHRHHKPVTGHRFSVGAEDWLGLCGVAIVGRPVARKTDYRRVAEVTRLCTDGTKDACSFLYGACARAAKALGFARIQTFILESETGISLKASGWKFSHLSSGKEGWQSREQRRTDQPTCVKALWVRDLC